MFAVYKYDVSDAVLLPTVVWNTKDGVRLVADVVDQAEHGQYISTRKGGLHSFGSCTWTFTSFSRVRSSAT